MYKIMELCIKKCNMEISFTLNANKHLLFALENLCNFNLDAFFF